MVNGPNLGVRGKCALSKVGFDFKKFAIKGDLKTFIPLPEKITRPLVLAPDAEVLGASNSPPPVL